MISLINPKQKSRLIASIFLAAATSLPAVLFAEAADASRGRCSGTSRGKSFWFLRVMQTTPPNFVNVKLTIVQEARNSSTAWRWDMYRGSVLFASGTSLANNPSFSFETARKTRDLNGSTLYRVRAANTGTGEVCEAIALL